MARSAALAALLALAGAAPPALAGDPPAPPREEAVIRLLERRATEDPRDFLTRTMLGEARARRGRSTGDLARYVAAEEAFRDALRLMPDHRPALVGLAGALASQHRFREALETAGKAIAAEPTDPGAHAVAFDAAMESGRYDRADEALAALAKAAPGAGALLARQALRAEIRGDIHAAVALADRAAAGAEDEGADEESRAWYEARCGDLRFHRGELDGARARFEAALKILPAHPAALLGLVSVRRARNEEGEARKILEQLAERQPTPGILFELGDLHAEAGRADDAARVRKQAVEIATREGPWRRTYRREMAEYLSGAGNDPKRAEALAREDLEERGDVHGRGVLAVALFRCGRTEEAAAEMEKALALGTHEPSLWEEAALILLARGEKDRARDLLLKVKATAPFFLGDEGKAALERLGSAEGKR